MDLDLDKIDRAANSAPAGTWRLGRYPLERENAGKWDIVIDDESGPYLAFTGQREPWRALIAAAAEFVVAAQPAVVRELVRRIRVLQPQAEAAHLAAHAVGLPAGADIPAQLPGAVRQLVAELDALRGQVAPDGVAEALQRLIENGATLGPASAEDALLVARHRQSLLAPQPAIPDGWQLVPKEPTAAMVEAGAEVDPERGSVWDAMLAASPKPGDAE